MKKIVLFYFLVVFPCTLAQRYEVSAIFEDSKFSISTDRITYNKNDSIIITFTVINTSDSAFFIFDYDFYGIHPTIFTSKIYFELGGQFFPDLGLINKLKILEPNESFTMNLYVITDDLNKSRWMQYKVAVDVGIFKYDKDLVYLTQINKNMVSVKDENDMYKLITLFKSIYLAYLPIIFE